MPQEKYCWNIAISLTKCTISIKESNSCTLTCTCLAEVQHGKLVWACKSTRALLFSCAWKLHVYLGERWGCWRRKKLKKRKQPHFPNLFNHSKRQLFAFGPILSELTVVLCQKHYLQLSGGLVLLDDKRLWSKVSLSFDIDDILLSPRSGDIHNGYLKSKLGFVWAGVRQGWHGGRYVKLQVSAGHIDSPVTNEAFLRCFSKIMRRYNC